MCLSNVDMEPSRNVMGCRDISSIQNSHQLKPEVVLEKHISIL